ncbi:hypothetical protein EUC41_27925 [Achromobacter denitrificans]|uniref:hypothetical protein n=1 Tax=Achromobacter denitrificans TaxID=32002 RepID=UPI0023E8AE14|nr:hypothetical protein [Achromobacter denitrificans]MBV2157055.1 hypothetical protein [Achromobacter denitrificans]MDF3849153.1 hypothetical protein [Achromobacter denitrificans]MDX3878812.1 hypothetical protein [Achromobacter sp.]WFC69799.1 hypothetical protein EUC41_27925 [Achromobacter denitrificans]
MPRTPDASPPDPGIDESSRPDLGPSDSSDSASDLPPDQAHTDSDAQGTGDRESDNPRDRDPEGADIGPDHVTDADQAGVSRRRPDPVRNGG